MNSKSAPGSDKKLPSPSGARASNAGDEFHFRYSARRALRLLDANSGLTFVQIEGAEDRGDGEQQFLSIDTTEYFGGDTFANSTHVIASQLKYSPTSPNLEWTIARLTASKAKRRPSLIKQLAQSLSGFLKDSSPEEVSRKLTIQLVSNQPANLELANALAEAKWAVKDTSATNYAELQSHLTEETRIITNAIHAAAGLTGNDFCVLLRVLDLTGCGQDSLAIQDALLMSEAGPYLGDTGHGVKRLVDAVRDLAQPGREGRGLNRELVVAALGAVSLDYLFPAPSAFEKVPDPIPTVDVENLAKALIGNSRVLAHGEAGIGKSTTVQLLEPALPEGTVVITYDCWGAGECFQYGGARHTHARALRQIINEISVRLGLPLLVGQVSSNEDLEFRLKKRLKAAAEAVGDGLLVIAIDAADNAAIAGSQTTPSFVEKLWSLELPKNCRLLMTARTHRQATLAPTPNVHRVKFSGFDELASTTHLLRFFGDTSAKDGALFHQITGGNPRLQTYKLRLARDEGQLSVALDPGLNSLKILFDDLLASTTDQFGQPERGRELIGGLVCMPRPIQVQEFASAHCLSDEGAMDFLTGLAPGLVLRNGKATLRDEDFDAYLREALTSKEMQTAHDRLATFLLKGGLDGPYAARTIAEHLEGAQRFKELIDLGLSGEGLGTISDDLLRVFISRRRLELALAATVKTNNSLDAAKLMLLASRTAKSDWALTQLIEESPELAAAFGDSEAIAKVLLRSESESWYGRAHLRAAALCARDMSKHESAKRHLAEARGWLQLYVAKPSTETGNWHLSSKDLSYGGQAVYFLSGMSQALEYMLRWSPSEEIVAHFFEDLVGRIDSQQLCDELMAVNRPSWVDFLLSTALWQHSKFSCKVLLKTAMRAAQRIKVPDRKPFRDSAYDFIGLAEARMAAGCNTKATLKLLDKVSGSIEDLRSYHPILRGHETQLRAFCLKALILNKPLTIDDLALSAFPESEQSTAQNVAGKRTELKEALLQIFPIYMLRAQTLSGNPPSDALERILTDASNRARGAKRQYRQDDNTYNEWAQRAYETILMLTPVDSAALMEVAHAGRALYGSAGSEVFVTLAEQAARAGVVEVSTKLLESLSQDLRDRKMPAQEKAQLFLKAATTAERFDMALSHDLYLDSIQAADGVDDQSAALVGSLSRTISEAHARPMIKTRNKEYGLRLARLLEIHQPFVSDMEYLPVQTVLESVARLWPTGGLVIGARWADSNIALESETAPILAEVLTSTGCISSRVGVALLYVAGAEYDPTHYGLKILESSHKLELENVASAFEMLTKRVLRDVDLAERPAALARLEEWASQHNLILTPIMRRLTETKDFLDKLGNFQKESSFETDRTTRVEEVLRRDLSTAAEVSRALTDLISTRSQNSVFERFAALIADQTSYGSRLETLKSILETEVPYYQNERLALLIIRLLERWTNSNSVRSASAEIVDTFFDRYALPTPNPDYRQCNWLRTLAQLAGPHFKMLETAVIAVTRNIGDLGPREFYYFADLIATQLDDAEFVNLIDWFIGVIDQHSGEVSLVDDPVLANYDPAMNDAIASYLWKIMGYPSRPVTWLAVHAAREIVSIEGASFVESLVSLLDRRDAGPFNVGNTEHFWMSARVMLLTLFLRLAHEHGHLLRPHAQAFAKIALDQEFPHAQMRELARRIALSAEVMPGLDASICAELALANQPRSCRFPREEESYGFGNRHRRSRGVKFNFDEMDTLPYWFDPLDRVFCDPYPDTLARADYWISTVWARTSEECHQPPPGRRWGEWADTSNRHGSIPPIESLQNHLEFHAMMCAAGEMCDQNLAVCVPSYEGTGNPWVEWLESYLPGHDDHWTSDLREPTLLMPELWRGPTRDLSWCSELSIEELIRTAQLQEEFVVLQGNIYNSHYSGYESVEISSALVSSEMAISLAAAVETAGRFGYRLSQESDAESHFAHGIFKLSPTVALLETRESLDNHDPLSGSRAPRVILLAEPLTKTLNLRYVQSKGGYYSQNTNLVAYRQFWDDTRRSRYEEESGHCGSRLLISRTHLFEVLNKKRKDLIVAVSVSRTIRRDYEENREIRSETTKAFALRRDGRLDPIRADCFIGK